MQITIIIGCILPVIVAQLVFPWYLSDAARERLADSFCAASQLIKAGFQV
jgi:hypothetical protein